MGCEGRVGKVTYVTLGSFPLRGFVFVNVFFVTSFSFQFFWGSRGITSNSLSYSCYKK